MKLRSGNIIHAQHTKARFHTKHLDNHSSAEVSTVPRFQYTYNTFAKDDSLTSLSERHLSRPTSVLSLSGLVGEAATDYTIYNDPSSDDVYSQNTFNPVQDLGTLVEVLTGRRNGTVRIGQWIRWVVFLILLSGTISDSANRIHHYLSGDATSKGRKGQLGSAMISSVTGILSPVLPFAGGMDLRRDDNWKSYSNWKWIFGQSPVAYNARNQDSVMNDPIARIPRGGAQTRKHIKHDGSMILSAAEPFFPLDDIAQMTLREVAYMFRYVVESGKRHFDLNHFIQKDFENEPVNKRMVNAVKAMQKAVEASRGKNISPMVSDIDYYDNSVQDDAPLSSRYGEIDALHFCGAMRILAEWRVLRQVPPGYKGYKVGMDLGHKDVVQNLAKIESAVHDWISQKSYEVAEREAHIKMHQNCKEDADNAPPECFTLSAPKDEDIKPRSPSLRELLQFEIEIDHHPNHKLPRLKEKSAAMGLLWVRRQLHYQTAVFNNVVSVPKIFPNAIAAVASAYSDVYGEIHGWTVQKIFNYSFKSAPHVEEIFCHMNPTRHAEVKNTALNSMRQSEEGNQMDSITVLVENSDSSNDNAFFRFFSDVHRHIGNELEKFGDHFGGEWDKVVCNVSNIIQHDKHDCFSTEKGALSTRGGSDIKGSSGRGFSEEELDRYVKSEMAKDASNHIVSFLRIVKPVLSDLEGLFDEMNMDDPTKV